MSIGLIRETVTLEPHCEEWELAAEKLIEVLKDTLKVDIVDAQHIGSTSIKNIMAKPIIDIVVGVTGFDKILKYNDILYAKGIFYRRQDHPGQYLYVCSDEENKYQTHYIHVVIWGEDAWNNYINMRDYLNTHNEQAIEYSTLKQNLALKYPNDRIAYTNGKSSFIENILITAKEWKKL